MQTTEKTTAPALPELQVGTKLVQCYRGSLQVGTVVTVTRFTKTLAVCTTTTAHGGRYENRLKREAVGRSFNNPVVWWEEPGAGSYTYRLLTPEIQTLFDLAAQRLQIDSQMKKIMQRSHLFTGQQLADIQEGLTAWLAWLPPLPPEIF